MYDDEDDARDKRASKRAILRATSMLGERRDEVMRMKSLHDHEPRDDEIARLRQELRDMRAEFESATERAAGAHALYVEVSSERDALLEDACRYRHIRNPDQLHIEKAAHVMVWEGDGYVPLFGDELDASIDDEMAGGK